MQAKEEGDADNLPIRFTKERRGRRIIGWQVCHGTTAGVCVKISEEDTCAITLPPKKD